MTTSTQLKTWGGSGAGGSQPTGRDKLNLGRIIVPLDGSPEAEVALPYAIMMASWWNSELLLIHVIKTIRNVEDLRADSIHYPGMHHDRGQRLASSYLQEVSKKLQRQPIRNVRWSVTTGDVYKSIITRTVANRAGMLVFKLEHQPNIRLLPAKELWNLATVPFLVVNSNTLKRAGDLPQPPNAITLAVSHKNSLSRVMPHVREILPACDITRATIIYPIRRVRRVNLGPSIPPIEGVELEQAVASLEAQRIGVSVVFTSSPTRAVAAHQRQNPRTWHITSLPARSRLGRRSELAHKLVAHGLNPTLVVPHRTELDKSAPAASQRER